MTLSRNTNLLLFLLLALVAMGLTSWAYAPALDAGFYFDDRINIEEVRALHWETVSVQNLRTALEESRLPSRWFANASFALNHVMGGLDPRGYHLVNVLLHLLTGGIVGWTCWLLLASSSKQQAPETVTKATAAMLGAVFFLVHPLQTQAVTYVVQRMAVLAALFGLLAFGLYLEARRADSSKRSKAFLLMALISWIIALGSKENAVLIPGLVGLYECGFHRQKWSRWIHDRWAARLPANRQRVAVLSGVGLLVLAAGLAYLSTRFVNWPGLFSDILPGRDFTGWQRVLTQGRAQILYLSLVVWPAPSRLSLDHDIVHSSSLVDPWITLPAVLIWLLVGFGALWLLRRRPELGFPCASYLLLHAAESAPVNLELVFEHRMYLPMAAIAWLGSALIVGRRHRVLAVSAVLAICTLLALATHLRNLTWADPLTFYRDTAVKAPNKPRPHDNLASFLFEMGEYEEAKLEFQAALEVDPSYEAALRGLAKSEGALGNTGAAEEVLAEARRLWPGSADVRSDHGNSLLAKGRVAEAITEFEAAVVIAPGAAELRHNLGVALIQANQLGRARQELEAAQAIDPQLGLSRRPLGDVYLRLGMPEAARRQYEQAVLWRPGDAETRLALGTLLGQLGEFHQARAHLEECVRLEPGNSSALNNLGNVYRALQMSERAEWAYSESLKADPANSEAQQNLSSLRRPQQEETPSSMPD